MVFYYLGRMVVVDWSTPFKGTECEGVMKKFAIIFAIAALAACHDSESVQEFTGNETTYELVAGSEYPISGSITFKERFDGFTTALVALKGTSGDAMHPVHLHLGNLTKAQADVAALLSPVNANTGLSETVLSRLADDTPVRYTDLANLDACIKIHLSEAGPGRDVVLAGGNIGSAYVKALSSGRAGVIAPCKSN